MALSGLSEMSACLSAFWGGADIGRRGCLLWSDANDPLRSLAGPKFCTAATPDLMLANPLCCQLG
jgi:hypothetical protein